MQKMGIWIQSAIIQWIIIHYKYEINININPIQY